MEVTAPKNIAKDFDQLVIRLERNHRCVLRLVRKLTSYKYEPRNYECFIQLRDLRHGFQKLGQDQMKLFDRMQHREVSFKTAENDVNLLFGRFRELERDTAAYITEAQNC